MEGEVEVRYCTTETNDRFLSREKIYSLAGIFWCPTIHIAWAALIFKQHGLSRSIIISSIASVPLRLTAGTWLYGRWNLARFKELDSHVDLGIALKTYTPTASTQLALCWALDKCLICYLLAFPLNLANKLAEFSISALNTADRWIRWNSKPTFTLNNLVHSFILQKRKTQAIYNSY